MARYYGGGSEWGLLNKVVAIAIALFIVAVLLPPALNSLANATMTNVDPAVVTVLQVLLPILAVIGIALYFMPRRD